MSLPFCGHHATRDGNDGDLAVIRRLDPSGDRRDCQYLASRSTAPFFAANGGLVLGRRVVTICREGVYYIFVLAFIVGGATLRDINLLFILAGIMVGPLLFNWRFVVLSVRELSVQRRLPAQIYAGQPFHVDILSHNHRRRLGSWMIAFDDSVEAAGATRRRRKGKAKTETSVVLPYVAPGETGKATYEVTLPRRGRYQFGPLYVSTRFPMGLVRASAKSRQYEQIVAWPRLGRLTPQWLQVVSSERLGQQAAQFRQGPIDGDYFGIREWRPGDSKRWIHWRTAAKIGKLAVRQFEQVFDQDMILVLDLWQPPGPSREQLGRVELAVSFAATIVNESSQKKGCRVTVALAGKQRGNWSARASATFVRKSFERLAVAEAATENRLDEMLGSVVAVAPSGAQLVVVSSRPSALDAVGRSPAFANKHRHQRSLDRVLWLDVGSPQIASVFQLDENPEASDSP